MRDNKYLLIFILIFFGVISCDKAVAPKIENDPDDPIEMEENEVGTNTFNFKVRIYDRYTYNYPVNYLWGSKDLDGNSLVFKANFDGRVFSINDGIRNEDFIYGGNSEVWESDSYETTGIRIEWTSENDNLSFDYSVHETDLFNGFKSSKTVTLGEFNNNFGINATVDRKSVGQAAFIVELGSHICSPCFPIDSNILESIESIQMQNSNGDWMTFDSSDRCNEDLIETRGALNGTFNGVIMTEDFDFNEVINFRMNNSNGLSYYFQREIGVLPFANPIGLSSKPCRDWETYINHIYIHPDEILNDYLSATQLPRTVDYFPIPIIGDTMKYKFKNHAVGEGVYGIYDYFLIPIDISINNDTTIVLERHMYGDTSPFGGQELNPPQIDTVQFTISNRIINSLEFFPMMHDAVDIYTHFPADAADSVQYKGIQFSREDGIIGSSRCFGCDRQTKWRDVYTTWLIKDN